MELLYLYHTSVLVVQLEGINGRGEEKRIIVTY